MKKLFILLLLLSITNLYAQKSTFSIVLLNKEIGIGNGYEKKVGNGKLYHFDTVAEATVLFKKIKQKTDIDLEFDDKGFLKYCKLNREKNNEKQNVEIKSENGKLLFINNGEKSLIEKPIRCTATMLLFKEPVGLKEVFIERLNIFVPIENKGNGLYKVIVEGGDNYYQYENGVLVEYRLKKIVNVKMSRI